jgi:hypothetical protein
VRAEALAAQGKPSEARAALAHATALAGRSEFRAVRLLVAIAVARLDPAAQPSAELAAVIDEAAKYGLRALELDARLVLAERRASRNGLEQLEAEARRLGYGLLELRARQAREVLERSAEPRSSAAR